MARRTTAGHAGHGLIAATFLGLLAAPEAAHAQGVEQAAPAQEIDDLRSRILAQQKLIEQQSRMLEAQQSRLDALEQRMTGTAAAVPPPPSAESPPAVAVSPAPPVRTADARPAEAGQIETVGEAPEDQDRPPEVAVLGNEGAVLTRAGQLTTELQFEYSRSDRNRALFRGVEVIQSILVGVFDINESHQDVMTASVAARYGLTRRLEVGVKLPFVHRSDKSILTPIAGSTNDDEAATIDSSVKGNGIGDLEVSARYQLTRAKGSLPFLIANVSLLIPTGDDPFKIPRTVLGNPTKASTGAGFWGISPSLTAILPTDPAVLFGSIGYTRNFSRSVDTRIPPVVISHVDPGDSIAFSAGMGLALNSRTSINLGYAHTWAFGTRTATRLIDPGPDQQGEQWQKSRDMQIGRLLFGISHQVNQRTTVSWSVEVGATDDATDVRTTLRIPFVAMAGK